MKDYSISKEDAKTFVLKYEINRKDNLITVYLASKQTVTIPYSVENEKKILEKMKTQILSSNYKPNYEPAVACIFSTLIPTAFLQYFVNSTNYLGFLTSIGAVVFLVGTASLIQISNDIKIDDFNKNKIFVLNEDKIRDYLSYIKSDTKITINDLDNFKYKEIAKLVDDANVVSKLVAKTHIKK